MNQNDYIILFDENGAPYIEHGVFDNVKNAVKGVGKGVRENHKYLLKVIEKGKARYFYTQEEVRAYYNEKKNAANKALEDATKKTKETLAKAKTDVSNKVQNGQAQYERMKNEFRAKADQTTAKAKDIVDKSKSTVKDAVGITARDQWRDLSDKAYKAKQKDPNSEETQQLVKDSIKANVKYHNYTPLGIAEMRKRDLENAIKNTTEKASDSVHGMIENARKTANAVADSTKETASKVATKAKETATSASNTAKDVIENARKTANAAADATKETASKVANKAKETTSSAAETAKDMVDRAKDTISEKTGLADRKEAVNKDAQAEQSATRVAALTNSLNNHRKNYAKEFEDQDHTYRDDDGYYYKTKEQRDHANNLIGEQYYNMLDARMKNTMSRFNMNQYADTAVGKAETAIGKIDDRINRNTKLRDLDLKDRDLQIRIENEKRNDRQRANEKIANSNATYHKKPDPINSSGVRPYETMKQDAREAGVDFTAYSKASSNVEKIARRLMSEYEKANNSSGHQSLYTRMWYEDPEYKQAVEKRSKEEEKLVKQLYK